MLLFLVYMTYALFKVHGNSNINMSQPKRWRTRLAGTRFVSYKFLFTFFCCVEIKQVFKNVVWVVS
jgi:hypothetical protein